MLRRVIKGGSMSRKNLSDLFQKSPGSGKRISLIHFIKLLIIRIRHDGISAYAYHLTYNLLLSFFPLLIFLVTLVGYASLDSSVILVPLETYLPKEVYKLASEIVIDVVDRQRDGLMSFSILVAIYSASGGFRAFMEGTNRAMRVPERRNIIIRFLISIISVILFGIAIVIALLGIVFGQQIISLLDKFPSFLALKELLQFFRFIVPEAILFLLLLTFYMFVPAKNVCFRCAVPGAIFTTLTWTAFTLLFQYYVNTYANYSKFYGALGAVIVLMLWLLLTSMIMLFGVEINALMVELGIIKAPNKKNAKNSSSKKQAPS